MMNAYREIGIVDKINAIQRLLDVCIISHGHMGDKESVMCVLLDFVIPKLKEINESLKIHQEDDE